jgi:type IX secretion system PorP/SprF family membrane protein
MGQYSPIQSQYMFNPVALNPAFTGAENALSVVGSFRAQWIGFPGAPKTEAFTIHTPIKDKHSSVGIQIFGDQIGVNRNLGIFGLYAYRLKLTEKSTLSLGVSGGVNLVRANYSQLNVATANDELIASDSPLGVLPEFSVGAHYYTDKYFVSLSAPMFLSHEYDGTKYRISNDFNNYNIILGGGFEANLYNKMVLKPSVLFKFRANNRIQADFNAILGLNEHFDIGLSYRTEEAILVLFQARINKQFSVMYSFGFPISQLRRYSSGSHELSVKYNFLYKTKSTSPRYVGW